MKRRPQQIESLCEKAAQSYALGQFASATDTEAHTAWLPDHIKLLQQCHKIWIGAIIKHDESGIYNNILTFMLYMVSMRMSTDMTLRLKQSDIVIFMQMVGNCIACNAATNNGYLQFVNS